MFTYCPEVTKVKVNSSTIEGFLESKFLSVTDQSILMRLQATSKSVPTLLSLISDEVMVNIDTGIFNGSGERITYLDESGVYTLSSYHIDHYPDTIPAVNFIFTKYGS